MTSQQFLQVIIEHRVESLRFFLSVAKNPVKEYRYAFPAVAGECEMSGFIVHYYYFHDRKCPQFDLDGVLGHVIFVVDKYAAQD